MNKGPETKVTLLHVAGVVLGALSSEGCHCERTSQVLKGGMVIRMTFGVADASEAAKSNVVASGKRRKSERCDVSGIGSLHCHSNRVSDHELEDGVRL